MILVLDMRIKKGVHLILELILLPIKLILLIMVTRQVRLLSIVMMLLK